MAPATSPPQIPLDLIAPEPPGLHNFVLGHNAEVVHRLQHLANSGVSALGASALVLWGGPSVGKTHLLQALANELQLRNKTVQYLTATSDFPDSPFIDVDVLLVDNAQALGDAQQAWLFTAFNHVTARGGAIVAAADSPPLSWPYRVDIRSRMGSGLVLEVLPIPQDELPAALDAYARSRGLRISAEVITYLLSHTERNLATLCAAILEVDRLSLAQKRPITVPLLKSYLLARLQNDRIA